MQWMLVKSWAKSNGYTTFREKIKDSDNRYDYYWSKDNDVSATGLSTSVSKLAAEIYNHMTDNQYIEYQQKYQQKIAISNIDHDELSSQW